MRCDREIAKVNRKKTCDKHGLLCNDCWLTRKLLPSHFMYSIKPERVFQYMSALKKNCD